MSKALLKDHLLIEFLNDPEMNRGSIDTIVSDIFELWRRKSGRHYSGEQISNAFSIWWLKRFEQHLFHNGQRVSYRQFLEKLAEG